MIKQATKQSRLTQKQRMNLRHYGASSYCREKFLPISDGQWIKPRGGLWASPAESKYGWREWCEAEQFGDLTEFFDLEISGGVLVIDCLSDLDKLPWCEPTDRWVFPLFQPLTLMGVDAIHLTEQGLEETKFSHPRNLYGWDCESVLILNPSCIIRTGRDL